MHVRCPHCHQPVELVENVGLEHIDCPSCGSHFSLLGEQTASYHGGEGRTIGHFELIERLGTGQFGTVWMARDSELDRTVAVKIPRQEQLGPGDVEMFLREARAAAQLHHPNIVSVHEVGRDGDTVYIVSDLVRGVTLADRLTAGRLSPREAATLCVAIADALHHAHQAGVIHRDLKPSNIMIDADGQPHLMDFGLAKREAAEITMTLDGRILGTPAYMSPEQARGEAHQADARSDIYSLGTILFELLTGELPFRGNKRMLLMQIIHDEPPNPRKLDAAVPRDLETLCLKCIEKSPERRYATAREVADELRRYLAGHPIHARPVGRVERSWRWCKRNRTIAALAASVMITLVTGTGVSAYFAIEERIAKLAAEGAAAGERRQSEAANAAQQVAETERNRAARAAQQSRSSEAQVVKQEAELRTRLAQQYLERGAALCAAGDRHAGMLWFMRAYDAVDARHAARVSGRRLLAGWCADLGLTFYHPERVTKAEFAAGANRIVTSCADQTCMVWDASSGRLVAGPIECEGGEYRISPGGHYLATGNRGDMQRGSEITVRDLKSGECLWKKTGLPYLAFPQTNILQLTSFSSDDGIFLVRDVAKTLPIQHLLYVLDPRTGNEVAPRISRTHLRKTFLSGDSKRVLILEKAEAGQRLALCNLESGEPIGATIEVPEKAIVQVSVDGNRAVTHHDGTLQLWDLTTGAAVGSAIRPASTEINVILLKDGGAAIVTPSRLNGQVHFIDAQTAQEAGSTQVAWSGSINAQLMGLLTASVISLSPNEKLAAVRTGNGILKIVRPTSGKPVSGDVAVNGYLLDVTWSADSRFLATTSIEISDLSTAQMRQRFTPRYQVQIWKAPSAEPVGQATHSSAATVAVRGFTRDNQRLVVALHSGIEVWNVPPGDAPEQELRLADAVETASFVPARDALLLRASDRTVRYSPLPAARAAETTHATSTWRLREIASLADAFAPEQGINASVWPMNALVLSPQGTRLYGASDDWTCHRWSVKARMQAGKPLQHGDVVRAVAVSRDGKLVATGSSDRSVRVWKSSKGTLTAGPFWHSQAVTSLAFFPDASRVVAGCEDGAATIWDCASGMRVGPPLRHAKAVRSLDVSADGSRILTGSDDETARLWDAATGGPLGEPLRHESTVNVVRFCPKGDRFVSASTAVFQWDARTITAIGGPMDHAARVDCAAYSPNGEILATACEDHKLRIWDVGSSQLSLPPVSLSHLVRDIAFHPDGETFFTACSDGLVRQWKARAPVADEPDRLRAWVEVATAADAANARTQRLPFASWLQRQEQLLAEGGYPRASTLTLNGSWSSDNFLLAITSLRLTVQRATRQLRGIAMAMRRHTEAHRGFPPQASRDSAGRPLLSWRVHLLPFLGEQKLYDQFKLDEPWDGEHNRALIAKMPALYQNPWSQARKDWKTCFVVPTGPGTCFDGERGAAFAGFKDGTSLTIMLVAANAAHAVTWTKPEDLDLRTTDAVEAIRGLVPGRCVIGFADGHVELMPCELPEELFPRSLFMAHFTRAGREQLPREQMPDASMIEHYRGKTHPLDAIRIAPKSP